MYKGIVSLIDDLQFLIKHQPGRHDQQRHAGTRGGGHSIGTLYHYTRPENVESILREGLRKSEGLAGTGVYLTNDPEGAATRAWSTERMEVELDPNAKVLELRGIGHLYDWIDEHDPTDTGEWDKVVMDAGYDALYLERGKKPPYTVVYNTDVLNITGHSSAEQEYIPTLYR